MAQHSEGNHDAPRSVTQFCTSNDVQDAIGFLYASIRFSKGAADIGTVAIVSPGADEGREETAVSLAVAMGAAGSRVLLLECDMRERTLHAVLHPSMQNGLAAFLMGKCALEEAAVETEFENVEFLGAESGIIGPERILNLDRFDEMLRMLKSHYEYVVINTPPALDSADAAIVAGKADATALVVREQSTEREGAQRVNDLLMSTRANVLGVVLASA